MPNYEVTLDDGRKLNIVADDRDTAIAGAQQRSSGARYQRAKPMVRANAPTNPVPSPVVCQIINSDRCEVDGLVVKQNAPVLAMCRRLIEVGSDPDRPLEAYRGEVLCLRISSIGYGAKFTVKEKEGAPTFRRFYEAPTGVSTGSATRPNESPATLIAGYVL